MNREESLARVRSSNQTFDVLIIGGGATGIGCALDAATRGLNTVIIEKSDFGKGTSSRSTKLIHGGVRYLEQGNISLVREALKERGILKQIAPDFVFEQEFVVPVYGTFQQLYYGAGLKTYDKLAGKYSFGRSRFLSKKETKQRLPSLSDKGLTGGISYFDGRFDDARFLIELTKTAAKSGAEAINYCELLGFEVSQRSGNIFAAKVKDIFSGEEFEIKAHAFVNATGAFSDEIRRLANPKNKNDLSLSRGSHIVLPREIFPSESALMIPKTEDGRVLFAIPWKRHVLVGTTDIFTNTTFPDQKPSDEEIKFLIDTCGKYFSNPISKSDITSAFSGIRPLVSSNSNRVTSALSREHSITVSAEGLITVSGGKWTTFRKMAQETIDKAAAEFCLTTNKSVTKDLRIDPPEHSNRNFDEISDEEILHFVQTESARTVEDVLARRTRVLFTDARHAIKLAPQVAVILSKLLGKDQDWTIKQTEEFQNLARLYLA
ncbi:MAG: glycerol-3-phosphate dehydrogenase/oxidase [Pyrinomonadaceae bacterium]